ncbi:hypothetical protein CEXT_759611 [Caerostris extrusa]|uniref:Uncharacterized protein n=1 Tax=Caerostris extrusa TaxID=172846 RepID=A0AAV4NZ93_CAEEX|nr:hypothetical protein CEXT_759611 [Caerostris extrusa]
MISHGTISSARGEMMMFGTRGWTVSLFEIGTKRENDLDELRGDYSVQPIGGAGRRIVCRKVGETEKWRGGRKHEPLRGGGAQEESRKKERDEHFWKEVASPLTCLYGILARTHSNSNSLDF